MAWTQAARDAAAAMRQKRKLKIPWRSNREKAANRPKTQLQAKEHPLVADLNKRFPTGHALNAYMGGLPTATLLKGVRALNTTSYAGAGTKMVREAIANALKGRK